MMPAISASITMRCKARRQITASALPQRDRGANGMASTSGVISSMNRKPKYGGPTEMRPIFNASPSKGYNVPSSTVAADTLSIRLPIRISVSREASAKGLPPATYRARPAYSSSEPPTTTARKPRMNTPRLGSAANECTEVSTPERTRNVPSSDNENAKIASSKVHARSPPRLSVTACAWINAVPTSHGMKLAFSTGSQNHQPPQPSSEYAHQLPATMPAERKPQATLVHGRDQRTHDDCSSPPSNAAIANANATLKPT